MVKILNIFPLRSIRVHKCPLLSLLFNIMMKVLSSETDKEKKRSQRLGKNKAHYL